MILLFHSFVFLYLHCCCDVIPIYIVYIVPAFDCILPDHRLSCANHHSAIAAVKLGNQATNQQMTSQGPRNWMHLHLTLIERCMHAWNASRVKKADILLLKRIGILWHPSKTNPLQRHMYRSRNIKLSSMYDRVISQRLLFPRWDPAPHSLALRETKRVGGRRTVPRGDVECWGGKRTQQRTAIILYLQQLVVCLLDEWLHS